MSQKFALVSVSDKAGIGEFAQELVKANYQILSTGGTMKHLEANGIPVTSISEYTKSPGE